MAGRWPGARHGDRYADRVTANRLGNETSPYLRQHADNPVDWYPWGDEAFALAEAEDRPVFLSIGYSACHWCHVMAHESFEDAAVAATLNATFVPVKVDREERPDVDAVYMEAVLALTGSGGWPMSVFLTPDRRPFFGGTYFPAVDRPGLPSFTTVLAAVDDIWRNRRPEVEQQADELADAVASRSVLPRLRPTVARATGPATRDVRSGVRLEAAVAELADRFDGEWGGFGPAPKFPQPTLVDIALRHALRTGSPASLQMATRTLDAMAAGGIHDHLGGGFSRYSTDAEWLVPHFEKMLYDQAGLLAAFIHGWAVTGDDRYLGVAEGIVNYVLSDLAVTTTGVRASARPRTPTRRASRGGSTSGRRRRWPTPWRPTAPRTARPAFPKRAPSSTCPRPATSRGCRSCADRWVRP